MNNNAIHILRTKLNNTDDKVKNIVLSEGQPFFNIITNKLYVGDGNKEISKLKYIGEEVDQSLQSQISTEITNRTNADNKLQSQISAEVNRSTTFDNSHNNIENHNIGSKLKDSFNSCETYKSFLYGYHLTATSDYQVIFGQYNDVSSTTPDNKTILAVGGGNSSERKNLFEVSSTASKFNTSLNVSVDPKENGDVLRWGDLTTSQDNSGGTYLTKIEFDGKTLKYWKGSSTVWVTDNQTGSIVTNVTGNNNHTITLSRGSLSGGKSAQAGYYISQVNPNGLDLQVKKEKIPDVGVTPPTIKRQFVSAISSNGHGITYSMDNIDGNLPGKGGKNTPIYTSGGSFQECGFKITVYNSTTGSEVTGAIAIYV